MFNQDITNNPRSIDKHHLGDIKQEVHPLAHNDFPASQDLKMPPLNRFNLVRIKPQTNLQGNLFTPGNQIDYYVNTGYTEKLVLEINYNVTTAAVTPNFEFCIDRLEIISNGEILSTIRGINLWHQWLFKSYDQTIREVSTVNKNTSLVPQSVAVGNGYQHHIHLWSMVDYIQPRLNSIKSNFLFRIYFTNAGIVAGNSNNITVTNCDIIAITQQLSGLGESLESERKMHRMLNYRFLNPIRADSETRALNPSSDYYFRLTSSNGLVAFIVFHLTPVGGAPDNFSQLASYEMLDENNTIVGINIPGNLDVYVGESFIGYAKYLFPNCYLIPFSFVNKAIQGCQTGYYKTTTKEQIHIYTGAGFAAGNYLFEAYTYEYNVLHVNNGTASISK